MNPSTRRLTTSAVLLALALAVVACGTVINNSTSRHRIGPAPYTNGSGKVTTVDRSVGDFHRVSAESGLSVTVRRGATSVKVTADDNLVSMITTEVRDGTLYVTVKGSIETSNQLSVVLAAPALDGLAANHGTTIDAQDLEAAGLHASAANGSTMRGGGKVTALTLTVDTGSTGDLRNVESETATVHVTSGSTAHVNASKSVTGDCNTGSTLIVHGAASTSTTNDSSSTVSRG